MDIQNVNVNTPYYNQAVSAEQKVAASVNASKANEVPEELNDGVEFIKTQEEKPVTYNKTAALDYLRQAQEARMASFKNMISQLLNKQGEKYNATLPNLKLSLSGEDVANAQKAIEEGGEWSVSAVAGRIMDMAKALSGGDASKIGVLKNAVIKGFKDAEKAWGGQMPEITGKTYDAVMKAFDEWEAEAKGTSQAS